MTDDFFSSFVSFKTRVCKNAEHYAGRLEAEHRFSTKYDCLRYFYESV